MRNLIWKSLVVGGVLLASGGGASADVLWDQSQLADYTAELPSIMDQEVPPSDPLADYSSYAVTDVDTAGESWIVQDITTYFSSYDGESSFWQGAVEQARLNILPKTGSLPDNTYDPCDGELVDVTLTTFAQNNIWYLAVTASGLDISLSPGEYWIGLTPLAPFTDLNYQQEVPVHTHELIGDESAWRRPDAPSGTTDWTEWGNASGGNWLHDTDRSITIQGVPEPGALSLLVLGGVIMVARHRPGRA